MGPIVIDVMDDALEPSVRCLCPIVDDVRDDVPEKSSKEGTVPPACDDELLDFLDAEGLDDDVVLDDDLAAGVFGLAVPMVVAIWAAALARDSFHSVLSCLAVGTLLLAYAGVVFGVDVVGGSISFGRGGGAAILVLVPK